MKKLTLLALIITLAILQIALPTQVVSAQEKSNTDSMFEGDISDFTSELPNFLTIKVREDTDVVAKDGTISRKTFYEQQTINPHSEDLSPEQRLGIFVAVIEDQIQSNLAALKDAKEDDEKKEIIAELQQQFADRYSFDTAYDDYKAKEVEATAMGLRKEVDSRKKSAEKWVDAMITLVQARANGIQMMDLSVGTQPGARQSQLNKDESSISSASDTVMDVPANTASNQ